MILILSVYPMKIYIFWNDITKHYGQVSLDKNGYQGSLLVSFTETPSDINTDTHIGEQISSPLSNMKNIFATKLQLLFGAYYRIICYFGMKHRVLKS